MYARELIVDGFAGGGGASEGILMALGRDPDLAYNHDAEALAMHRINHPGTKHVQANIMQVDPLHEVGSRPVGLAWFSPDCKHHSKAKGGKPVKRAIRDLAWVVVLWAKRARPRVILLENVEEFRMWGPLVEREPGRWYPDPDRAGQTFDRWVAELRRLGYRVEWRELRACDYGAPTIRKRLFLIARRDGHPIVWPEPTHGAPDSEGVRSGRLKPWRTAAEIIDWSQPCHSIFLTREEGRAVGVKRPLVENTMARVAKGVVRYVLQAPKPYIVHHRTGHVGASLDAPLCTVTANGHEKRPGGAAPIGLVAPVMTYAQHGGRSRAPGDPLHTIAASTKDQNSIVVPYLVPRYGERPGQEPRTRSIEAPAPVIVPTANGGSLAAVHLQKHYGKSVGQDAGDPAHTLASHGKASVVAAFLAQHNTGVVGHAATEPVSTLSTTGSHQQVVSAGMVSLKGSDRRGRPIKDPAATVLAGGGHAAEVRAFLTKYYGPSVGQDLQSPTHTTTAKARFGLVTVNIGGEPYAITDIGLRMLTPRELFRAQGFGDHYVIDRGMDEAGRTVPLTGTAQIRMCGNSVCPDVARALVAANYQPEQARAPRRRPVAEPAPLPLFAAE